MLDKIKQLFSRKPQSDYAESLEDLSPNDRISQKSVDTERPAFWFRDRLIIPPFNLSEYLDLYLSDPLAKALIDSDTHLTVSPLETNCDSDELDSYVAEFNRRIDLDVITWQLVRDANLYGFGIGEIVGNGTNLLDSTELIGVKRLDPRFIIVEKTQDGRYRFFRQRPGFATHGLSSFEIGSSLPTSFDRPLDPQSIIYVQNWSPLTSYGHSILQSLKSRLTQRNQLIDASVQAYRNHANAVIHLHYTLDPVVTEDKTEVDKQRKSLREQVKRVDKGESRWLVSGGRGTYTASTIGHTTLPDSSNLLDRITQDIIIAAGHSPSSLGYTIGSTGVTTFESSNRITINTILTKQRNVIRQLQSKLFTLLPLIESECPDGEIIVTMKEPTAESVKEKYEANAVNINNAVLLGKAGIISGQTASRELGYEELEDETKWDAMTAPQLGTQNPNDPNASQQTRAAIVNSTNAGNNPAGGK